MWIRLLLPILIGAALGGAIGFKRSCTTGGCPFTANPRRGAVWGGIMGLAFSVAFLGGSISPSAKSGHANAPAPPEIASKEEFETQVLQKPGMAVVYFHAPWCPACKRYAPVVNGLASALHPAGAEGAPPGEAVSAERAPSPESAKAVEPARLLQAGPSFHRVNVDNLPDIAKRYGISAIPVTLILRDGEETQRFVGRITDAKLRKTLGLMEE